MSHDKREIYPVRALRRLPRNVVDGIRAFGARLRRICKHLEQFESEGDALLLATLFLASTPFYVVVVLGATSREDLTSRDFFFSMFPFGFIAPFLIATILYLPIYVLKIRGAVVWAHLLFVVGMLVWVIVCPLWHGCLVLLLFAFLPLIYLIDLTTRWIQTRRGIHFTCPACSRRGLPGHVCPNDRCGKEHLQLWPSMYGLLWHYCCGCDTRLWTLDIYGKLDVPRRCRNPNCRMPLAGKHAGRVPERLVAIAGSPGTGKSCYLMMAVNRAIRGYTNGTIRVSSEIDVPAQREQFAREWRELERGIPPAKTAQVDSAFLLYVDVNGDKSQLYLYDAPGEEFESVGAMNQRHYYSILKGLIVLVDPSNFNDRTRSRDALSTLENVVRSSLSKAISEMGVGKDGKLDLRLAVVISKADLVHVRQALGGVPLSEASAQACHDALVSWGGQQTINAMEHRVRSVDYFACSALGRSVDLRSNVTFQDTGVLEPLIWILTGKRSRSSNK